MRRGYYRTGHDSHMLIESGSLTGREDEQVIAAKVVRA